MKKIKTLAIFKTGNKNQRNNIECQDFCKSISKLDTGGIALADGAGSKKYSRIGAEVAVNEILNILESKFELLYNKDENYIKKFIFDNLLEKLNKKSDELNINISDMYSTLLFVYVKKDKFFAGHIGDGLIAYLKNNKLELLSKPENGEFANQTYFIKKENLNKLRLYKGNIKNISSFILMSDGGQDTLYNKRKKELNPISKNIMKLLRFNSEEETKEILDFNIEKYFKKYSNDDCSIALINII